ncbi:MAG: hypothetical protein ABL926_02425 [Novosphingobium sp.]|uniref:hypothetical protein n=1 Tax=Novosphingobium sp. TaxID=1874826 RepID=UPI0032B87F60
MKLRLPAMAVASLGLTAMASSLAAAPPSAKSPFLGKWELDVKTMPVTYGTPPKSVTYDIVDLHNGRWETRIHIVDDNGVRDMAVSYARDGQANSGSGYAGEGDSAAVNSPAPNVLVMSLAKDKGLESVRVYAVSANGKEMTESAADVDDDGKPFVRNFRFTRARR